VLPFGPYPKVLFASIKKLVGSDHAGEDKVSCRHCGDLQSLSYSLGLVRLALFLAGFNAGDSLLYKLLKYSWQD